ncbi:MAG: SAM-dependent chlorinase/fluorinase [Sulfuricaulis sp.]|uniref:S-adenosyl-l-methionine hydroxide adenosyltransferase family protein n=1 Tax=Sulfuricaulis sp. TaxID=2003553 RepID=UPI0034A3CC3E
MIVLFTDFGLKDPYIGQMHAVLAREAPGVRVIDLFHSVPVFNIRAGAYLLPVYAPEFPPGAIFVCVVDPGVGGERRPVLLKADGHWFVGPDNGLFEMVQRRAGACECRVINWRPPELSASFHGRDLFAPVAAKLAGGQLPDSEPAALTAPEGPPWPDDLAEILYVDHYGNGITGWRAKVAGTEMSLHIGGKVVKPARVFSAVPPGTVFWYANANGLVEIAAHRANASLRLGFKVGDPIKFVKR